MKLKHSIFALVAMLSGFAFTANAQVAKVNGIEYQTLSAAFAAVTSDDQTVVILSDVTENLVGSYLRGNITTENGAKVTITLTNSDWVYCPYTFVLGKNITLNMPTSGFFYYAGGAQINGTVEADAYYQRYAGTKLIINEPGSMKVTGEQFYLRYMDGDPNAGIYINGDNDPSTVGLDLSVAYFYQGMINAKNANIEAVTYWQTNETDGQGSANLVLDNSKLVVSVYDHPAEATGNSTVTLTNGSVIDAKNGGFTYGDNTTLSVDATSKIIGKNGALVELPVATINGKKYTSLQAAIEAVQEGETITVLNDITFTTGANGSTNGISYTRGVSFGLDLNGKTITSNLGNNALRFKIGDGNTVTNTEVTVLIKNGKIVSGSNNWCAISAATADNSGNKLILNLTDLTIEANKAGDFAVKSWAGAVVNTNNVDVTSNYAGGFYACGGEIVLDANSSVAQKGLHTDPYMSYAVGVSGGGKMTVNGGTYSAVPAAASDAYNQGASHGSSVGGVMSSGGTLIINGGTFSNDNFGDAAPTAPRALLMADAGAVVTINGGTFNAMAEIVDPTNNTGVASKNAKVTINGGTFSANPTDEPYNLVKLAEGCAALPNLNGEFVVGAAPTATVNKLGAMTVAESDYIVYNGSKSGDMPLSFVMQFLANQDEEDMETSPFADWYGDFVLTFSGLSANFVADGCYLAGYYGDFGWVKVPVDGMTIENEVRYPVMLGVGLGQKYEYICSDVKDFRCALYLTPEILEANPDLTVTLELSVVDNSKGEDAATEALVNKNNIYEVVAEEYAAIEFSHVEFVDGKEFVNEADRTVASLTYKRTLPYANFWMPLYVPFNIPMSALIANYDVARFNGVNAAGTIELVKIEDSEAVLEANTPLVIRAKSKEAKTMEITLNDVVLKANTVNEVTCGSYKIRGTYQRTTINDNERVLGMSAEGKAAWGKLAAGVSLNPQRLILTITDSSLNSIRMRVVGEDSDEDVTNIYDVEVDAERGARIFDLQGRRVLEPQKGHLYIINGKKVVY